MNVRYRKNENFRRIRAQTLLRILQDKEDPEVRERRKGTGQDSARARARVCVWARKLSPWHSIRLTPAQFTPRSIEPTAQSNSPDVLLLDLRESDAYDSCHLRGAVNYPIAMLSRSLNPFIPEILAFCNREPQKIIVLYDLKERLSVTAGNLFFEKGIDNVFVLSKGMNGLVLAGLAEALVGDVPQPLPSSVASSVASTRASSAVATPMRLATPMRAYQGKVKIKLLSSSMRKSKPSSWH